MKKEDVIKIFNLLQTDENVKKVFDADISARIPYYLHCCVYDFDREVWVEDDILYNYDLGGNCQTLKLLNERGACLMYYQIRPYLRPMSSMTDEELYEVQGILGKGVEIHDVFISIVDSSINTFSYLKLQAIFDWLNAHHFDYRGLIEKGLALVAPKDMYTNN